VLSSLGVTIGISSEYTLSSFMSSVACGGGGGDEDGRGSIRASLSTIEAKSPGSEEVVLDLG